MLRADSTALGVPGTDLVPPLLSILHRTQAGPPSHYCALSVSLALSAPTITGPAGKLQMGYTHWWGDQCQRFVSYSFATLIAAASNCYELLERDASTRTVPASRQDDVPDVDGGSGDDEGARGSENGEAASALLRALACADPAVLSLVKTDKRAPADATAAASRCSVM